MDSRDAVPKGNSSAGRPKDGEDPLIVEQRRLERRGRLHWLHWLVIALSGVLTLLAWHYSTSALETQIRQRFETHASDAIDLFAEKLHTHADLLRASAGLLEASEEVTRRGVASLHGRVVAVRTVSGHQRSRRDLPRAERECRGLRRRAAGESRRDFDLRPVHTEPLHLPLSLIAPRTTGGARARLRPRPRSGQARDDRGGDARRHGADHRAHRTGRSRRVSVC